MKNSKQVRRDARQFFRSCLVNGRLDESRARKVAQFLSQEKPRGYMSILTVFQRLVRLDIARRQARIESAVSLTPDFQSQIQSDLTRVYGAGLSFTFVQNPALLGGTRVQVGCDVYDGSVSARLKTLRENFS